MYRIFVSFDNCDLQKRKCVIVSIQKRLNVLRRRDERERIKQIRLQSNGLEFGVDGSTIIDWRKKKERKKSKEKK